MEARVRHNSVQKQAAEKLRERIIAGDFKAGERLVESELCEMLGVSRPSVREALRSLEGERLITSTPNKGIEVTVITWRQALEIYRVRALLEGEAAATLAVRAQASHISAMELALKEFATAVEVADAKGLLRATTAFYEVLISESGNSVIGEILRGLLARVSLLRDRSMSTAGRASNSLAEMTDILSAIKNGDAVWAREAAVRHVEKARDAARQNFLAGDEKTVNAS